MESSRSECGAPGGDGGAGGSGGGGEGEGGEGGGDERASTGGGVVARLATQLAVWLGAQLAVWLGARLAARLLEVRRPEWGGARLAEAAEWGEAAEWPAVEERLETGASRASGAGEAEESWRTSSSREWRCGLACSAAARFSSSKERWAEVRM
mmetsp:Transcript_26607/g.77723  ORF Transcript_26607/g.77723 Transcript_26607/m.77723 type:complete len:153 (-) Transcript_26607:2486-2944(-)